MWPFLHARTGLVWLLALLRGTDERVGSRPLRCIPSKSYEVVSDCLLFSQELMHVWETFPSLLQELMHVWETFPSLLQYCQLAG